LAGAIHRVVALMEYLPTLIDQQLRHDADLGRLEYAILLMLAREPDRTLSMLDLSLVTFGSLSRLSHTVTKLCGRGFSTRERRGANRDATQTNNGHKALVAAAPGHVAEARRQVFDHLPAGRAADLADLLRPIVNNMKAATPRR
jgi:DNA-binding MarR family transcriptional regulator